MRYKEAYEQGCEILTNGLVVEAQLDARLLLEAVCNTNRNDLLVHGDKELTGEQAETYADYIEKRRKHYPLQYIIGQQEFMGLSFLVDSSVLIPRQDTECLVEEILKVAEDGMKVLDMCTGSGCILLSIMNYKNNIQGTGIDISKDAIALAEKNAVRLGVNPSFYQGDMFYALQHLPEEEKKFDLIVSNPPYIRTTTIESLMDEVKEFEPRIALDGKEDGLYFYRILAEESDKYLNPGGWICLETGFDQSEEVAEFLLKNGYCDIAKVKDLAGLPRVVCGRKEIQFT